MFNMLKHEKSLTRRGGRMTYILGANCIDGVALVADRKVTFKENLSHTDYKQKLFGFPSNIYYPIVVGCAGSTVLSDQFEEDIKAIARNYYGERIKVNNFISQLISKIRDKTVSIARYLKISSRPMEFPMRCRQELVKVSNVPIRL